MIVLEITGSYWLPLQPSIKNVNLIIFLIISVKLLET